MYSKLIGFLSAPNIRYWARYLSKFLSIQIVVQILAVFSGIIIIRTLSKEEYAYFTVANSLQATMNVLADSGISTGMMAIGGRVYDDSYKFSQLLKTGMKLRKYLGLIAAVIITPLLFWFLTNNGASYLYTSLIVTVILTELYFYLIQQIFTVVPLLRSNIRQMQYADLISNGSRLLMILAFSLTTVNALIYTLFSTIATSLKTLFLYKSNDTIFKQKVSVNKKYESEVLDIVKGQISYVIFFCVQGQITIWLITIFGQAASIAEVGALGRLGVIFALFGSVISQIVIPSFARCKSISILRKRYLIVLFGYLLLTLFLMGIAYLFPVEFLWILGKNYSHMTQELPFVVLSSAISSMIGLAWGLNTSRGWVKDSWMIIPATITVQLILLMIMDLSIVINVIAFGIFSLTPTVVVNFYMNLKGFNNKYPMENS
jgi:O-antigen/teichoic acid export membrane protein